MLVAYLDSIYNPILQFLIELTFLYLISASKSCVTKRFAVSISDFIGWFFGSSEVQISSERLVCGTFI